MCLICSTNYTVISGNYSSNPGVVGKSNDLKPNTSVVFNSGYIDVYPIVNYTDMRVNEQYGIYYINWARNIITGILTIASLIIFNQLVYKKLVKRRNLWKQGNNKNCFCLINFFYSHFTILQTKNGYNQSWGKNNRFH